MFIGQGALLTHLRLLANQSHRNDISQINIIKMKALHIISAVVGGAIAGAAVGLLVAPEKGKDTRNKIIEILKEKGIRLKKTEMDEIVDKIEEELEQ